MPKPIAPIDRKTRKILRSVGAGGSVAIRNQFLSAEEETCVCLMTAPFPILGLPTTRMGPATRRAFLIIDRGHLRVLGISVR